jgi:hypothetical protein
MRTNIEINSKLVREAHKLRGSGTKEEAVVLALEYYIAYLKRQKMGTLFGKIKWEGDLHKMRRM